MKLDETLAQLETSKECTSPFAPSWINAMVERQG